MKYRLLILFLFIGFIAYAQQPKAYQMAHYYAQVNGLHFRLDYGEGYLAASKVMVSGSGVRIKEFMPTSDSPEDNGDFVFKTKAGNKAIKLTGVNEVEIAPKTFRAIYYMKGGTLKVLFTQKDK